MDFIKELFSPQIVWFIAGIIMLILEFTLPGLIIFFFGVGACVVGILNLIFDLSLNAQLIIFIITSVVLLLSLRKWLKNTFLGRIGAKGGSEEDPDDFAGEEAVVVQEISPGVKGKVEFHGTEWKAASDVTIKKGTRVKIISKSSITLNVKPV